MAWSTPRSSLAHRSLPARRRSLDSGVASVFLSPLLTLYLCPRRFHIFFSDLFFRFTDTGFAAVSLLASAIRALTFGSSCPAFIAAIQPLRFSGSRSLFLAAALTDAR